MTERLSPKLFGTVIRGTAATGAIIAAIGGFGLLFAPESAPWHWPSIIGALLALVATLWPRPQAEDDAAAVVPMSTPAVAAATASGESPLSPAKRAAEQEVKRLRSELERHRRLEQELTLAKQAAEAAMMSKGEFLATMSHEIRTPLNGIIPLLDILLGSPLGPDQRDYVQTAFGSAKQLLRIVDDILDYSKLDANKLELETVGLNLKEVVESVIRLMEKPAESKGLRLELIIDPAVRLAVRGDPVRLRQVLTNLVSNAIKFTERGSVTVSLLRRGASRSHHDLRFEIRDTGIGIAPEAADRLFKAFSQADTSTTRTFGGTGLGLVICKRIVDLMGGQIGVESEPGRGSLFWFQVPLLKAVGDIDNSRGGGLQGARVMVLTADPMQMRRFSVALPNWGSTPVPASTTQEALNKLRAGGAALSDSWGFQMMLVDFASIRSTALALHRGLARETGLAHLKIVYMVGDEVLPPEIATSEHLLSVPRGASDAELRPQLERILSSDAGATAGSGEPEIKLAEAAPAVRPQLKGHVLLVEDNPVNRQVAQRLLTLSGLTLDAAENGKEAVERLSSTAYDAVLMDCQMPVMDGYTATRHWRRHEQQAQLPHMPIIAMTANAMVGDREKCLDSGMDDYLSKPLNRALLEETIRQWLDKPRTVRSAPMPLPELPAAAAPGMTPAATPQPAAPTTTASTAAPVARPAAPTRPAPPAGKSTAPTPSAAAPVANVTPLPSRPAAAGAARRTPPAAPAISREVVDDLRDIMGDEFASLVRVFLEDAPRSLARLQAAAAANDIDALIGPAHSLKSTSANLGAMELSAQAKQIEHGARQKSLDDPAGRVATVVREFERAEQALREMI